MNTSIAMQAQTPPPPFTCETADSQVQFRYPGYLNLNNDRSPQRTTNLHNIFGPAMPSPFRRDVHPRCQLSLEISWSRQDKLGGFRLLQRRQQIFGIWPLSTVSSSKPRRRKYMNHLGTSVKVWEFSKGVQKYSWNLIWFSDRKYVLF